ncbi:hypothetical protein P3L10_021186 [Capsicum annuum]
MFVLRQHKLLHLKLIYHRALLLKGKVCFSLFASSRQAGSRSHTSNDQCRLAWGNITNKGVAVTVQILVIQMQQQRIAVTPYLCDSFSYYFYQLACFPYHMIETTWKQLAIVLLACQLGAILILSNKTK